MQMHAINERELGRYVRRVSDRWRLDRAHLGGARLADAQGAGPQRERGPEYVVVLVSDGFDGIPWLERVYQAGSLWDAHEMAAPADLHCYTPAEFERRSASVPVVRAAIATGWDLLAPTARPPAAPDPQAAGNGYEAPDGAAPV
jgi:hypothetical protein